MVQYLSNTEMIFLELINRFVEFARGKRVGVVDIKKISGTDSSKIEQIMKKLTDQGFLFG